ncbi:MAG: GNAT family N-acetyltransferase [Bacteroidales bacterium]|nr:GNAT family N-acetyltransferase [Bacteroidales bacterium]
MKCLKKPELVLGPYKITPYREEDIFKIMKWRNEQIDILRQNHLLTEEEQKNYYQNFVLPTFYEEKPKQILFSYLFNNECIGYGGLTNIDWYNKRAELSFLVETKRSQINEIYSEDFTSFLKLIYQVTFNDIQLNRLFSETYEFRKFHITILEKNGFKLEGILREHVFFKNKFINSLIHSILKSEYEKNFKE